MNHLKYDVVLACGGLGSRLKEITKDVPKPLYPISNKSTLERCIEELIKYSFKNILITIGFKSIYFRKFVMQIKKKYKINIFIYEEPKPLGECGALWNLKEKLNNDFIFINGDLVFSIDFEKLINYHTRISSILTLVTHTSDHPEDSDLVSAPNGSLIKKIFLKNSNQNQIKNAYLGNSGIFLAKKNIIDKLQPPQESESNSFFHYCVKKLFELGFNIYSYNTTEYIKDMGTPDRFRVVENDLNLNKVNFKNYQNKQKALFLDRDNTLIECNKGDYILDSNNINLLNENIKKIALISKKYQITCLVTNQPAVAMGKLTLEKLDEINSIIIKYCIDLDLKIDVVTFCPHHPHAGFEGEFNLLKKDCFCRKPNPGLFFEQAFYRNIQLNDSLMIGDSEVDFVASKKAGCFFKYVNKL